MSLRVCATSFLSWWGGLVFRPDFILLWIFGAPKDSDGLSPFGTLRSTARRYPSGLGVGSGDTV